VHTTESQQNPFNSTSIAAPYRPTSELVGAFQRWASGQKSTIPEQTRGIISNTQFIASVLEGFPTKKFEITSNKGAFFAEFILNRPEVLASDKTVLQTLLESRHNSDGTITASECLQYFGLNGCTDLERELIKLCSKAKVGTGGPDFKNVVEEFFNAEDGGVNFRRAVSSSKENTAEISNLLNILTSNSEEGVPIRSLEELLLGTAFDLGSVVLVEDGVREEVQIAESKPTNERTIALPSLKTQTDVQTLSDSDKALISIILEQFPYHVEFYRGLTRSDSIENVKLPLRLYTEGLGRSNSISDRPPSVEFTAEQQLELIKLFRRTSIARECLRDYQIETFESIIAFLEDENRHSGFVRVPTGFGKTVLFALASAAYDQKTLVLVPTLQLAEQTKDRFNQFCPDINVGIICDGKNSYNNNCSVLITTYATFNSDQRAIENSDTNSVAVGKIDWSEFELVILDEAHQTGIASEHGDNEAVTLGRLRTLPAGKKLGCSATPYYARDGRDLRRLLPDIVFNLTLRQLFERVDASSIVCPIEKYEKLVVLCSQAERKEPAYTSWIVDRWKNNYSNRASLLYCSSIEEAQALAEAFQGRGVQARSVTSKDSNTAESLNAFKRGDLSVLISVQQLTTGTDLPRADHIWVLHPLTSAVTLEQIVGRGLRLNPDNPDKSLLVSMNYHDPSKGVTLGDVIWANHFDTEERYFSRSNRPGCFLGENNKVNSPRRAGGGHTHWFNCSTLVGDTQSSEHLKDGCITLSQLVADLSENEQGMNEAWLPEAAVEAYAQDSGPGNYYYREVGGRRSIYEIALSQELASYIRQQLTNHSHSSGHPPRDWIAEPENYSWFNRVNGSSEALQEFIKTSAKSGKVLLHPSLPNGFAIHPDEWGEFHRSLVPASR